MVLLEQIKVLISKIEISYSTNGVEGFECCLLWLSHIFQLTIYVWSASQQPQPHIYCNCQELKRYIYLIYFLNNLGHSHYEPLSDVVTNAFASQGTYNDVV